MSEYQKLCIIIETQIQYTMAKSKDTKKETKKTPVKSKKEKAAEKRDKKPKYD